MLGLKRNTHEMNFDGSGLIHLTIMLTGGDIIHLLSTEKIFIIGKKPTDFTSDITNQNKYISTPRPHSSYACGLGLVKFVKLHSFILI